MKKYKGGITTSPSIDPNVQQYNEGMYGIVIWLGASQDSSCVHQKYTVSSTEYAGFLYSV